jgi:hypothetical protein
VKQKARSGKTCEAAAMPSVSCSAITSTASVAAKPRRRASSSSLHRDAGTRLQGIARSLPPTRRSPPAQRAASASKVAGVIIHSMFQVPMETRSAAALPASEKASMAVTMRIIRRIRGDSPRDR